MKVFVITLVFLIVLSFGMVIMLNKNDGNKSIYNVGDRVSIKGSENCNCIVENLWKYKVSIVCSGHNGVTHEDVNPQILKKCNEKIKY